MKLKLKKSKGVVVKMVLNTKEIRFKKKQISQKLIRTVLEFLRKKIGLIIMFKIL